MAGEGSRVSAEHQSSFILLSTVHLDIHFFIGCVGVCLIILLI